MGQSNIALRTDQQTGTKELLADVARRYQAGDKDGLYRIDGLELTGWMPSSPAWTQKATRRSRTLRRPCTERRNSLRIATPP